MVWSSIVDAFSGLFTWALGLLPSTGCGALTFSSLNIGWGAAYLDVPVVTGAVGMMVGVEVSMFFYRLAWLARRWLLP